MMLFPTDEYRIESVFGVRRFFELGTVFDVAEHAKRPPCGWCGGSTRNRSYVHNAQEGCIHTKCRREKARFMAVFQDVDTARRAGV